jgi:hypothetical protein
LLSRAGETAYYLNGKLARLALIGKGIRFPAGTWIRVADGTLAPWEVEPLVLELFAALAQRPLRFAVLLTDFDVEEFDAALGLGDGERDRRTG